MSNDDSNDDSTQLIDFSSKNLSLMPAFHNNINWSNVRRLSFRSVVFFLLLFLEITPLNRLIQF